MIAPETLLRMHPLDALRAQIGEVVKTPLKAQYLKISQPTSLGGLKTQVEVSLDRSKAPLELWDRVGNVVFEYDRLDITAFTAGLDRTIKASLPAAAGNVINTLLAPYGIPVVNSDIVDEAYTSVGSATITAAEQSWRWIGAVECTLVLLEIDISQLMLVTQFTIPFDKDYRSLTVKARLAQYINMTSPQALPEMVTTSMFEIGNLTVNGNTQDADNTKATLTFNGVPYSGTVDIYYARRAFEDTFRWPVALSGQNRTDKKELASALSAQMGCTITASDIMSAPFPQVNIGDTVKLAVDFDPTSLAYTGSVLVEYSRTT